MMERLNKWVKNVRHFSGVLFSSDELDLSSAQAATESISKILQQEQAENIYKVAVAFIGFIVVVVHVCLNPKDCSDVRQAVGLALPALISALALADATTSKMRLLKSIKRSINDIPNEQLREEQLSLFIKLIESQSFPK
jgi:hypothetical protein